MKKYFVFIALLIFLCGHSLCVSAFNPDALSKSLVKLTVVANGSGTATASGFVYSESRYIITSLHVMKPGGTIKVEFNGRSCNAKVVNVHQKADLVLLEAIPTSSGLPPWTPIPSINTNPLKFAEDIYSVGYNRGSRSWISRKLSKGRGASEILRDLIPETNVTMIRDLGMPHLDLNVIYLDGSLLPGFSGAPLLNDFGQLVGIADGGLENGASNVSWGIPSREIDALFKSNIHVLPDNIGHASIVFSAEINAPEYTEIISFNDYRFVHTKTRTLQQLIDRSDDKETLLSWLKAMGELKVTYSALVFDVYEDIRNGYIITIPHGKKLIEANQMLEAQLNIGEQQDYYLGYAPGDIFDDITEDNILNYGKVEEAKKELTKYLIDSLGLDETLMVTEDPDESKIKQFGGGYLATAGFYIHNKSEDKTIVAFVYYKFIITKETSVVSFAVIKNYTTDNLNAINGCIKLKVDCDVERNFPQSMCTAGCDMAKYWMLILASVNLTTIANE